jgi:hypothetical protein
MGVRLQIVDELPGSGGIRATLDLDGHSSTRPGEPKDGVHLVIRPPGVAPRHGYPGYLSQDTKSFGPEQPLQFHQFVIIHNDCEYSRLVAAWPR